MGYKLPGSSGDTCKGSAQRLACGNGRCDQVTPHFRPRQKAFPALPRWPKPRLSWIKSLPSLLHLLGALRLLFFLDSPASLPALLSGLRAAFGAARAVPGPYFVSCPLL